MTLAFHGKSKARQRWLIVIAVAMVALAAFAGGTLRPSESARAAGTVMYSSIPAALPGNVVSQAFQATQASEFGDRVTFVAGSGSALGSVTVVLSSWGCQAGTWLSGDCSTTPGATFSHPVTLNLYQDGGSTPGALIAAQTQTFAIPYRPSADTINCTGPNAGKWYSVADARCYNGLATKVTFHFPNPGLSVPSSLVWGVAYNTTNWGYHPIGASACSATAAGCGYDSLNVGAESLALVGTDVDPNGAFYNSVTPGNYCDGGAGGTGTFRLDDGCWAGYRPMAEFAAPGALTLKTSAGRANPPDYHVIGNSTVAQAKWTNKEAYSGKFSMLLEKDAPTGDYVFAAAIVRGVEGWRVSQLGSIGFAVKGGCGGGSPRFNLYYDNNNDGQLDGVAFYGCGNHVSTGPNADGWTVMSVNATAPDSCYDFSLGICTLTGGSSVVQLSVLVDETGTYFVDDVTVAENVLGEPSGK